MPARFTPVLCKLAGLPVARWEVWRDRRFWKNAGLSLLGWAFVNAVFIAEVKYFGMNRQTAHATKTPIGYPLGIALQLMVFGDRVKLIRSSEGKRPKLAFAVRWVISKAPGFLFNQVLFWAMVVQMGMPLILAPFVLPPIASFIHYIVDWKWTFAVKQTETA